MLQELSIKNFAVIDDLRIRFDDGLTMLTGETGAGKSIIINAVNLLLGSRASSDLIRSGTETAELEALFRIKAESRVWNCLRETGFEPSEELLIQRLMSRTDRHRVYINGRLSTIQILNRITEGLAGVSGQHAHQVLLRQDRHLSILDQFGGLLPLRNRVHRLYHEIVPVIRKLDRLRQLQSRQTEQSELLRFQSEEIAAVSPRPDEDTGLEQEKKRLKSAESLHQSVHDCFNRLYGGQGAIVEGLVEVARTLEKSGTVDPQLMDTAHALQETTYRLEDIARCLNGYLDGLHSDDGRLEQVEARLDVIQRLKRKYGGSLETVFAHLDAVNRELDTVEDLKEQIAETERELERQHKVLADACRELSVHRKQAAGVLAERTEKELASLQMPHVRFQIRLHQTEIRDETSPMLQVDGRHIHESGIDAAEFMIAPNPGEELKPLSSIASGGELSRIVLALNVILARKETVETVVFDEVDAGIGGGTAERVGEKLLELAGYHQVICITHLPQIARFGHQHFKISKTVTGGRTKTEIDALNERQRIREIARMMGGMNITQTTMEHAREMLGKR